MTDLIIRLKHFLFDKRQISFVYREFAEIAWGRAIELNNGFGLQR